MNEFAPTPPSEVMINAALVRCLLASQHADLATLPLGDRHEGWDNVTWRLGPDLAVRLPRRIIASTLVVTELAWLPHISKEWPFAAPVPVRTGAPGCGFPWRWSVVPWVEGSTAYDEPLTHKGAADLGLALRALHQPAPRGAPLNPYRSSPLANRISRARVRMEAIAAKAPHRGAYLDVDAAESLMRRGAQSPSSERVCAHLDIHGDNVITRDGRLAGIIDWGDAGAGDRATDLGQARVLLGHHKWQTMLRAYGTVDATTRRRAQAEAIGYAVTLAMMTDGAYAASAWNALVSLGVATEQPH